MEPKRYDPADSELEMFNCVKFTSIFLVVVGNTYFYTLTGPLRNFEIVHKWFTNASFLIVMQADM